MKKIAIFILTLVALIHSAFAAGGYFDGKWYDPAGFVVWVAIYTGLLTVVFIILPKKMEEHHKKFLFGIFAIPILLVTVYLAGATVYENVISETKGPVHWHADYQVWYCGDRLDLINPNFPSNKIGTPLFHEHNDDRMHVEGTVHRIGSVSLGQYFEVIGGSLDSQTAFVFPTEDQGTITHVRGQECPNTGEPAVLNVFINGVKTNDYKDYVIYPHALVPPGDCIIYEIGPEQETTDRICESWEARGWGYDNYEQLREGGGY